MSLKRVSRRELLMMGAAAGATGLVGLMLPGCSGKSGIAGVTGAGSCGKISDIDYVVILIHENRSFDHYFGSYKGVRGFSDQSAAFNQPYPENMASARAGC